MTGSDDLMRGVTELIEARDGYTDAWAMWRGTADEEFSSPAVRRILRLTSGRYGVNLAKVPIKTLANRLKIQALTALNLDGVTDEEADARLQEILTENRTSLLYKRTIRNALIFGDSYQFIWKGDTEGSVSISYGSPKICRVIYDADNDTEVAYGIQQWEENGAIRATLLYADHLEPGWTYEGGGNHDDPTGWSRTSGVEDIPNPYGAVPLWHWRTDMPYGTPAHEDAFGPQRALNKIAATMAHTMESQGFSQRYGLIDPLAALNGDGGGNPDWEDDADAEDGTEDDVRLRSGPGEFQQLVGYKSVGEWAAANPDAFTGPADWWTRMAALVTDTPMHYIDQRGSAPSGESLRVADAPLLSSVDNYQEYLDATASDSAAFALTVAGYPGRRVDVRWKAPGIVDDQATWSIVTMKIANGVPPEVAIGETGMYEPGEIKQWMVDASPEMDMSRRVTILAQVATAMTGLSQGVALGLLSEEAARAVVDATIGQLTPELEAGPA